MSPKELEYTNKERILEAAAAEFADRGFDGARVDEIARRAGVNKALIYYYYKSKEELLTILFMELRDTVMGLINSPAMREIDYTSKDMVSALIYRFLDLLEDRQDVIRVVLMETAKRSPINDVIFSILKEVLENMFVTADLVHAPLKLDKNATMITEFFTGIMPVLDYVAYHEIWMDRFNVDEPNLRKQFVESFIGTHFGYTMNTEY